MLSTKGGPKINGQPDWSPGSVLASVERSLRLTRSERIDIFSLHSCPILILRRGDVQVTLDKPSPLGKSVSQVTGDNEPLAFAVESGRFGSIETSVNVADHWNLRHVLGRRPEIGVIAKCPIANAPWRFPDRPGGHDAELYWERLQALQLDPSDMDWTEFALRFTAYAPGVHTAIVGTAKLAHLRRNITAASRGPPETGVLEGIDRAWRDVGSDWAAST